MRITLVSAFDPNPSTAGVQAAAAHVGGVERVFSQVSQALARRGHEVTVVCSTRGAAGSTTHEGVRMVRVPLRATILRSPVARLAPAITPDADVVHVAATYPLTTPAVLRRSRLLGIPSILDFHFEPDGGTPVGRLAANAHRRIAPAAYRLAHAVLVRSMAYGRSAPSLRSIPEARWFVVPNGVDPQRFRPDSDPAGPAGPGYLLFVGRLVPYKGLDVLLRALAADPPGHPLLVVGDGPLRQRLEAQARRLGVDARFLGHVPEDDLPDLYRGALLTVLPSVTGQECFGITLLESMACGTPVVASDLPGVGDLARLGGLVARPGDERDLSRCIREALHPGALRRGWALASPMHEAFSWSAVARRLERVYEQAAASRTVPDGLRA